MKSILLIGLGRFGRHIAQELNELGHQVMAIDLSLIHISEPTRPTATKTV